MDWVLGLPQVTRNCKACNAVLAVIDISTRMIHFIPTCKIYNVDDTADVMLWNILLPSWPPAGHHF